MREKLQLHIPEPCHENWNQMTPVEQGRFCSSCQKNVIDFTAKDDEEILDFFKNYSGNTCGRFSNNQLNRPIEVIELKPASSFLKYAASLLLPALLFSTRGKSQFKEQLPKQVCEKTSYTSPSTSIRIGGVSATPVKTKFFTVRGIVIDIDTKNPIAMASVMIKGKNTGVVTDEKGYFSVNLTSATSSLEITTIGYEKAEVQYSKQNSNKEIIIEMKPATVGLLGEVIVVGYASRKMGGLAGGVSIRYEKPTFWNILKDTLLPSKVNIYPNPVSSSSTVNLSFPKVKEGLYQIRLFNATGQLFYSMQKQIGPGRDTEQLHLNSNMAQGIYLIQIIDSDNKLLQTSRLIVQ